MEFELRYTEIAKDVWETLATIPRTGWVKRKVRFPETVQEHTLVCRMMVECMIDHLPEFSITDILEILNMLEVHDYPEVITGDLVIVTYDQKEKRLLKIKKFKLEYKAMKKIASELGDVGKEIFALWYRFEKSDDRLASFARQIDKYQCIEKAMKYESIGENVRAQEFFDYLRDDITHPFLRLSVEALEEINKNAH